MRIKKYENHEKQVSATVTTQILFSTRTASNCLTTAIIFEEHYIVTINNYKMLFSVNHF